MGVWWGREIFVGAEGLQRAQGETEAQPSEGLHAARGDPVLSPSLCQDAGAEDELPGCWDMSLLRSHTL